MDSHGGMLSMRLIDMHCDTLTALMAHPELGTLEKNSMSVDMERLKSHEAALQFFACFVHLEAFKRPEGAGEDPGSGVTGPWDLDAAYAYTCSVLDFYEESTRRAGALPIRTVRDLKAWAGADICVPLADSGVPAACGDRVNNGPMDQAACGDRVLPPAVATLLTVEEGGMIAGKMDRLRHFYDQGVRLLTLTWNFDNCMGHPNSRDPKRMGLGLTPFGFAVVEEMSRLGMVVDVSHLSDGGFMDVARTVRGPFVASHSNARALCGHPRNLTDEMLRILAEHGGVTGLNFCPAFLHEKDGCTVAAMVRHISHIINVAGEDVMAIGTDFDGISGDLEIPHTGKLELLYDALAQSGMTARVIDKIFFGNAMRVLTEVLPEA